MSKINRFYVISLVIITCVGCDQISKSVAKDTLELSAPRSYFGELFRLQYAENKGAFLSLGSTLSKGVRTWLFTILSGLLLVGLFLYMLFNRELNNQHLLALSLILGGGFSNLLDRIVNNGSVIDFMNMGIGSLRTGIFNFADVLIMTGMALVIILNFRLRKQQTAKESPPEASDLSQR